MEGGYKQEIRRCKIVTRNTISFSFFSTDIFLREKSRLKKTILYHNCSTTSFFGSYWDIQRMLQSSCLLQQHQFNVFARLSSS
jgi:hypothetical protein